MGATLHDIAGAHRLVGPRTLAEQVAVQPAGRLPTPARSLANIRSLAIASARFNPAGEAGRGKADLPARAGRRGLTRPEFWRDEVRALSRARSGSPPWLQEKRPGENARRASHVSVVHGSA
jgi:hypothetical protein